MSWRTPYNELRWELLPHLSFDASSLKAFETHPLRRDDVFSEIALRVFEFQRSYNRFYAHWAKSVLGERHPASWREIPSVWTTAFKRARLACFPARAKVQYFRTSGTTEGESGIHEFCDLELYSRGALSFFRAALLPEGRPMRMCFLTPSPEEAPHSSLVFMLEKIRQKWATPESRYYLCSDRLQTNVLLAHFSEAVASGEPVFLLGTAFAFVYLLDALSERRLRFQLPAGSRIMETGGFKGRVREIERSEFYRRLSDALGVPRHSIVNEYGMTELSSQFYDPGLSALAEGKQLAKDELVTKAAPPWTRVHIVDPLTGREVGLNQRGLIRIYDLANLGSVISIQTEDVGVRRESGFEVIGRVASAPLRGCSLDTENALLRRKAYA